MVGRNEEFVRRISVGLSKIQTLQRVFIIASNAEILSSSLLNWLHKDRTERIDVSVGGTYGSDI